MKSISIFVLTFLSGVAIAQAQVTLAGGGLTLVEEGGTFDTGNLSTIAGSVAFSNGDLGDALVLPFHQDFNLNDGTYGNSFSWIGDSAQPPAPNTGPSFGGITFSAPQNVQSFAFGRDNTGGLTDRTPGIYTLQWTAIGSPGVATTDTGDASTGWATIGTLDYGAPVPASKFSAPHLRHRYNFTEVIGATAMRVIVPATGLSGGTAIDELEFYSTAPGLVTTAATGFTLGWDGNDGDNFDSSVPVNLALSGTAIGSGELGGPHLIAHANDGLYGNSNSWIGAAAPGQFIGIDLGGLHDVTSFAFGRDNGNLIEAACGGQCQDRSLGDYGIEFTVDGVIWVPLGTVRYLAGKDTAVGGEFTEYLRHEFDIGLDGGGAVQMSGLRIQVSDPNIAIDELEIFGTPVPEPSTGLSLLLAMSLILFRSRRRR